MADINDLEGYDPFEEDEEYDPLDDYCYECTGYGDDYFVNDKGELECRCPDCPFSPYRDDLDD